MNKRLQLLALVLIATFARESLAQATYSRPHEALVEAIQNGSASGILTGKAAEKFREQFNSKGLLYITVTRKKLLKQEGCANLFIEFKKMEVMTPKGPTEFMMTTPVNYCVDGSPPGTE